MSDIFSGYEKYVHQNEEKKEDTKKEDENKLFVIENNDGKKGDE